jgi:ribonuclease BN (tRNA processing enzyme)
MKFQVIGCSGGQIPGHNLSSYLLDNTLLIDAGSITSVLDVEGQKKIRNILITHVHVDHIMGQRFHLA